ncbi:UDP-N-acetylmuramoyl-tripeptide--D-alanyl-D-alanine ligase [Candidatus Methanobinarius endosymbioticus]|uniref:UDP-N-acetylmuramoyl-tripeptide--D-alanyl-D-alanine ligase n=1 Tax=Candidatus Methanobinarius endosymbioticus TaxID=2006182 RepID=A0A366MD51_9EURY|nr:UDP-N-acetylmuramoyl-tripeptide--D-alanyl-D-alanine ligase [Candidatus Methanobinarius endosymbioticus]
MDTLVVDLTHGGVKIAIELKKMNIFENIYVHDLYETLKKEDKNLLSSYNINILYNTENLMDYINKLETKLETKLENELGNELKNKSKSDKLLNSKKISNLDLLIINPVHSPFSIDTYLKSNFDELSINEITHHKAVKLILDQWKKSLKKKQILIIEVTGVKGKTSVVAMLKEILISENPLTLTSLGVCLYNNDKFFILKENISITPASILETINLAKKINNSDCVKVENDFSLDDLGFEINYGSVIFESSLGVTGLGDVGVLTNIAENYPIAKNSSNASNAKKQVFDCDIVVLEKETLDKYYFDYLNNNEYNKSINSKLTKINTFSFSDDSANVLVNNVSYNLNKTKIDINYKNIQTIYGNDISGSLSFETFAPGKHHMMNVLCALTTSLSLEIDKKLIISGLNNFKGIKGRTSLKFQKNSIIIEEINPGINTKAIESSLEMLNDSDDYIVILGGKYGITCEEIDEDKVASFLDNYLNEINKSNKQFDIILTDDLGYRIKKKMNNAINYIKDPIEAKKKAIDNNRNILFIYRSNYSQVNKR